MYLKDSGTGSAQSRKIVPISPPIDKKTMFENIFIAAEQKPKVTTNPKPANLGEIIAGDYDDFFYVDTDAATKVTLESKEADYLRGLVEAYCPEP